MFSAADISIIPQLIANSLIAAALYALIALGFNLIYGATKFFNLAHGAVVVVGGYLVFALTRFAGINVYIAVLIGVLGSGVLGLLLDRFIFLPLRVRKASSMVTLVASLGISTVLQAIIAMIFTSQFQTLSLSFNTKTFNLFGGIITDVQLVMMLSALVIMIVLGIILRKTLFGKTVEAISDNEEVARVVGIDTNKVIAQVFFIGSMIAGLAGILVGFDTGIEPTMGMSLLLKGVIASIIGGVGSVYGAVIGAVVLGFVENFGIWKISGEWKDAIAFGVLILFLLFRSQGILKR